MKKNIHPTWYNDAVVTCSCGHTFTTGSTQKTIQVDICSACHPFFTGEMRFVDRQGRVDKFKKKMQAAADRRKAAQQKTATKTAKQATTSTGQAQSYQEILREKQTELRQSAVKVN